MPVSLHGLDLTFMRSNPLPDAMKYKPSQRRQNDKRSDVPSPYYMSDIKPFVSPVGEAPVVISSRKLLRDHERAYNMHQVGNDFPVGTIAAKNEAKLKAREELAKGIESGWAT
jgi:hypothetical protein